MRGKPYFLLLVLLAGFFVAGGCSSSGTNLIGNWPGTWVSGEGAGSGSLTLLIQHQTQDATDPTTQSLIGELTLNYICFEAGAISGEFYFVIGDRVTISSIDPNGVKINLNGTVNGNTISGTYSVAAGANCTGGDSGTWSVSRS